MWPLIRGIEKSSMDSQYDQHFYGGSLVKEGSEDLNRHRPYHEHPVEDRGRAYVSLERGGHTYDSDWRDRAEEDLWHPKCVKIEYIMT